MSKVKLMRAFLRNLCGKTIQVQVTVLNFLLTIGFTILRKAAQLSAIIFHYPLQKTIGKFKKFENLINRKEVEKCCKSMKIAKVSKNGWSKSKNIGNVEKFLIKPIF